jgi:hypothetical protein
MKKLIFIIILLVAFPIYANQSEQYTPLTYEQADNYLDSVDYDTVVDIIIEYDYIEHTTPKVTFPTTSYVLFETDLLIQPMSDLQINHGNFSWSIPLESNTIYNFTKEKSSTMKDIFIFVGGTVVGILTGYMIGSLL